MSSFDILYMTVRLFIVTAGLLEIRQYMLGPMCESDAAINGKVVIITGAESGTGKEIARDLAKRGGRIYLACNDTGLGDRAATDITDELQLSRDQVVPMFLNLGSLASIRQFAKDFIKRENRLDILVNNAGVMFPPYLETSDGFESQFGINHLGHFLLTNLVSDLLVKSAPSRVVTLSFKGHRKAEIQLNNLMPKEDEFNTLYGYGHSKLANILFSRELSKRLEGTGVTTYALHPGMVLTELHPDSLFYVNIPGYKTLLLGIAWLFFKDPVHGAQTPVCCAVDRKLQNESGKYYRDNFELEPSPYAQDDEAAHKLWDISRKLVKLQDSETHPKLR